MNWQEVCDHPSLQNLPFKIELDEAGRIVMTPVKIYHSILQGEIAFLLRSLLQSGKTLPKCAIKTSKGTKVADVAWASAELLAKIKYQTETAIAPEICVEVVSSSNTPKEIADKKPYISKPVPKKSGCAMKTANRAFIMPHAHCSSPSWCRIFPQK